MKTKLWALVVFLSLAMIVTSGCEENSAERQKEQARCILGNTVRLINLVKAETKQAPPTKLSKMVDWFVENEYCESFVDERNRTVRDPWGSAIIIIAPRGKVKSLASKGPNGRWEHGKGDDIIVSVREVRFSSRR